MSEDRYYEDVQVGDASVSPEVTVTEAMVMTYAELTG
ncbi:acyl dehydratase, partial [Roseomonas sp. KE2513]|nr:acyl dehydratase [Roseomonas sp. KE2513]